VSPIWIFVESTFIIAGAIASFKNASASLYSFSHFLISSASSLVIFLFKSSTSIFFCSFSDSANSSSFCWIVSLITSKIAEVFMFFS